MNQSLKRIKYIYKIINVSNDRVYYGNNLKKLCEVVKNDQMNNIFAKLKSGAFIRYFYRLKRNVGNKTDF